MSFGDVGVKRTTAHEYGGPLEVEEPAQNEPKELKLVTTVEITIDSDGLPFIKIPFDESNQFACTALAKAAEKHIRDGNDLMGTECTEEAWVIGFGV